jgi:hypothetical protein
VAYGYGFAVVGHSRREVYFDDISKRPGMERNSRHGVHGHAMMYGSTRDPMFSHYEAGTDPFINLLYTFDAQGRLTGRHRQRAVPGAELRGRAPPLGLLLARGA